MCWRGLSGATAATLPPIETLDGFGRLHRAAPTALTAPHQQRAATRIEVGLGKRERLTEPQASAPEHDDQAAQPAAVPMPIELRKVADDAKGFLPDDEADAL